jgi:hypothetical protein
VTRPGKPSGFIFGFTLALDALDLEFLDKGRSLATDKLVSESASSTLSLPSRILFPLHTRES